MASGHVNRIKRPNTWLHRPMLQNVKKVLANPEPSTHDPLRTCCCGDTSGNNRASLSAAAVRLIDAAAARLLAPDIFHPISVREAAMGVNGILRAAGFARLSALVTLLHDRMCGWPGHGYQQTGRRLGYRPVIALAVAAVAFSSMCQTAEA